MLCLIIDFWFPKINNTSAFSMSYFYYWDDGTRSKTCIFLKRIDIHYSKIVQIITIVTDKINSFHTFRQESIIDSYSDSDNDNDNDNWDSNSCKDDNYQELEEIDHNKFWKKEIDIRNRYIGKIEKLAECGYFPRTSYLVFNVMKIARDNKNLKIINMFSEHFGLSGFDNWLLEQEFDYWIKMLPLLRTHYKISIINHNQALTHACESNDETIVKFVLKDPRFPITIWSRINYWKALMAANKNKNNEIEKLILTFEGFFKKKDWRTIFSRRFKMAIKNYNIEILKVLLDCPKIVGISDNMFKLACKEGNVSVVKLLLEHEKIENVPESIFEYVCKEGNGEVISFIKRELYLL